MDGASSRRRRRIQSTHGRELRNAPRTDGTSTFPRVGARATLSQPQVSAGQEAIRCPRCVHKNVAPAYLGCTLISRSRGEFLDLKIEAQTWSADKTGRRQNHTHALQEEPRRQKLAQPPSSFPLWGRVGGACGAKKERVASTDSDSPLCGLPDQGRGEQGGARLATSKREGKEGRKGGLTEGRKEGLIAPKMVPRHF